MFSKPRQALNIAIGCLAVSGHKVRQTIHQTSVYHLLKESAGEDFIVRFGHGSYSLFRLTPRFTGHKRNADHCRSAVNDEAVLGKAARLLWSFLKAVVRPSNKVKIFKLIKLSNKTFLQFFENIKNDWANRNIVNDIDYPLVR